ncbi:unnamed protein product [Prorocentrum cordatum]|uniref:Uncharacterized protein n=1 Tax=Prorocentrum cordatum TaxID=2364126 RepID=A0ABN9X433_9DINO|nr:unnamed protein product [Polarella glacialis]
MSAGEPRPFKVKCPALRQSSQRRVPCYHSAGAVALCPAADAKKVCVCVRVRIVFFTLSADVPRTAPSASGRRGRAALRPLRAPVRQAAADALQARVPEQGCLVPQDHDVLYEGVPEDPAERLLDLFKGTAIYVLPFAGPVVAFGLWPQLLALVHFVLGEEAGLLELTQLTLNPTTNGIVVASLGTALGTLTSITVWTLRQRQLDIRSALNKEACELQMLAATLTTSESAAVDPRGGAQAAAYVRMISLFRQYVARLIEESSKRADVRQLELRGAGTSELTGIARTARQCGMPPDMTSDLASHIGRLSDARSMRLASLSTAFPLIHWAILSLLAASISLCFLIEIDQYEGRFMSERPENSLRLRIVFTFLVGTFSGLSGLCADLNDPFRGSFCVTNTVRQFYTLLANADRELEGALMALNPSLSRSDIEREVRSSSASGSADFGSFGAWLRNRWTAGPRKRAA